MMDLLPWQPEFSETVWDASLNQRLEALEYDIILDEPRSALQNLALDETLLYRVAVGKRAPLFRLWDWTERAVILGSYQSVRSEFDSGVALREGFGFERRISGGGAMLIEPGKTITWSLIVPEQAVQGLSFRQSFAFLDMWCVRALRSMGIPATYRPINDIASPSGKIAGAAQCRRRHTVLHHVTMAYDIDQQLMWDLLRLEQPKFTDKSVASAVKRVSPLHDFTDLSYGEIRHTLASVFASMYRTNPSSIIDDEATETRARVTDKFSTHDWRHRVP